jgi:hypothetical protein
MLGVLIESATFQHLFIFSEKVGSFDRHVKTLYPPIPIVTEFSICDFEFECQISNGIALSVTVIYVI